MCRAGGRRCPSSRRTGADLAAYNKHRRELYAARKNSPQNGSQSVESSTNEHTTLSPVDISHLTPIPYRIDPKPIPRSQREVGEVYPQLAFSLGSDMEHKYSDGDCGTLAQELVKTIPGSKIVFLAEEDDEDPDEAELNPPETRWAHALVKTKEGKLIDVEGVWSIRSLKQHWSNYYEVRDDLDLDKAFEGSNVKDEDRYHAHILAQRIADALNK